MKCERCESDNAAITVHLTGQDICLDCACDVFAVLVFDKLDKKITNLVGRGIPRDAAEQVVAQIVGQIRNGDTNALHTEIEVQILDLGALGSSETNDPPTVSATASPRARAFDGYL